MTVQNGTGPQARNAANAHNGNAARKVATSLGSYVTDEIEHVESQDSAALQVSSSEGDMTLKTTPPEAPTRVELHESVMDYDVPTGYTREGTTGLQTRRNVRGDRRRIDVTTKRSNELTAAKFDGKLVDVISMARETLKQLSKEHGGNESYEGKLLDFGQMLDHFEIIVLGEHKPQIDNYLEMRDSCLILVVNRMYKELQKKGYDSVLSLPPGLH